MADHPMPWFPSANGTPCGTDDTESIEVVALLAHADFLLSAVTDEIDRSRNRLLAAQGEAPARRPPRATWPH
jgi:hypothetical protein